jgi:hypothetical protein
MMLVRSAVPELAMSFRLFVYYCFLFGAWAGFLGWLSAILIAPRTTGEDYFPKVLPDSIYGALLGVCVAFALSLLDGLFNYGAQLGKVLGRVFAAVIIGAFSGLFGGFIGSSLYFVVRKMFPGSVLSDVFFIVGWIIIGFLTGFSISVVQVVGSLLTQKDFSGSFRKLRNCVIGGTVGGILGGLMAFTIRVLAAKVTGRDDLFSPTAIGFVAIGACIGLLVGLAQIILKEAWIKVEAGFRPGREMLLAKEKTTIGRAEGSDIALFGDSGVEKAHANIVLEGGRYFLEDLQTPGGSYVNDQKVAGKAPLNAGDLIRVGKSVLRFNERAKRKD